ncbi:MAG: hypothetical protein ACR2P1_28855 [Pseudomonadales bacterium]
MPSPNDPICIVGNGATTAVGLNAAATAAAVRAGIDGFEEHPYLINQEGDPYVLAMVPSIDASLTGVDRYIAMSAPAIDEALEPLQGIRQQCELIAVVALPEKRPGLPDNLDKEIDRYILAQSTEHIVFRSTRTAFRGHALGLMALETAGKLLAAKECEFCLVGGIDSYIDPDTLDWVEENEQFHFPSNAWGFIPGEAASFCLLCSTVTAHKYKLPVRVQLVTVSSAQEKNRIKTETICVGEGLTHAVRGAVAGLPEESKIDYTICDQNGEAYRADEYGFMLCRLAENFSDPSDYLAPADCWGDVGAASGSLYLSLLVVAAEKGYEKGPYSLLWASSEGGERSAALIQTLVEQRRAV